MPPHAIIIGGGISGLSATYDLAKAGVPHTLIEKQPRLGGVIETRQWEDCVLECGPDSFLSAKPEAMALIRELGLEGDVIGSKDDERVTYILRHGRLTRLPEGTTMFVPTIRRPCWHRPSRLGHKCGWVWSSCVGPRRIRIAAFRNSSPITLAGKRWIIWRSRCFPACTAAIPTSSASRA